MTTLEDLGDLFSKPSDDWPPAEVVEREPRKHRHEWVRYVKDDWTADYRCRRCTAVRDETSARRGKQSRNYGNRAELKVARKYGGVKVGHAGGPVDVRGAEFNVQVKTHRRPPPREWTTAFGKLDASLERIPRLLLRFVMGPGVPPDDYFVLRADDWLRWFGKDESE